MAPRTKRVLIITGEASGDLHGAQLAVALKSLDPQLSILGVGGARMAEAGVQLLPNIPQLDVIGIIGPSSLRALIRRLLTIRRVLKRDPLDAVVLIDHPGLNFHFARVAKRAGRRVFYYIAPQIWAWRPRRMKWMHRRVNYALVILPFEEELYRQARVPCSFVGHPLLDEMAASYDRDRIRTGYGLSQEDCVVGLLPGSRNGEVQALLPVMLEAARRLQAQGFALKLILAAAETVNVEDMTRMCEAAGADVQMIFGDPNGVIAASDLVLIASGTATLQAAIIGTPMVIVYKMRPLAYALAKMFVGTTAVSAARRICWPNNPLMRSIGLPNLLAGHAFIPELIQADLTPDRLADEARRLLQDREHRESMGAEMRRVRGLLGGAGASRRAAEIILKLLQNEEAYA
jgi:lipid-A-disaccharide synthase